MVVQSLCILNPLEMQLFGHVWYLPNGVLTYFFRYTKRNVSTWGMKEYALYSGEGFTHTICHKTFNWL